MLVWLSFVENIIFEKDNLFIPWLLEINTENDGTCVKTTHPEIVKVEPNSNFSHERSPITDPNNAYYFKGSENMMSQDWVWTCEHICRFKYQWYPFDTQNCPIIYNSTSPKIRVVPDTVQYTGSEEVGKYYFQSIHYCNKDKQGRSGMFIDFTIKRPVLNNLLTLFLPTGMLMIISQMSIVFKELVIEVNTTLLLVLTT